MDIGQLLTALKANAEKSHKPIAVEIDGVGTIYVRRRTVNEFEELAAANDANKVNGTHTFAPAVARLVTDENGDRYSVEHHAELARWIGDQPEDVFQKLLAAADGKSDIEKAAAPGN